MIYNNSYSNENIVKIKTISGSEYNYNVNKNILFGGKLPYDINLKKAEYGIGKPALFTLQNGKVIRTSEVLSIELSNKRNIDIDNDVKAKTNGKLLRRKSR